MSEELENKDGLKSGLGVHPDVIANEEQEISTGEIPADRPMMDQLLLDPDEVCRQLESVNLTEEDTDILLQDALQLNKMLKAHLSKQEESSSKKSKRKLTPDGKKSKKTSSAGGGDLPPLDTKRGLSAAQMRIRQPPQAQQRGASASRSPLSTETSKPARSKTASSTSSRSRSKSTESNKKEWSDRW